MAIVINGSGTVTGLAVGGLPDGTVDAGTLATNSVDSAELIDGAVDDSHMAAMAASKLTGALPAISGASLTGLTAAQMPAGSLLQAVQATSTTELVVGTSATAIAPTVTITPSSSSNKILIKFSTGGMVYGDLNSLRLQIKRGSTVVKYSARYAFNTVADWNSCPIYYEFLDSPSTTSATTYSCEVWKQSNNTDWIINSTGGTDSATAIAMEIKG